MGYSSVAAGIQGMKTSHCLRLLPAALLLVAACNTDSPKAPATAPAAPLETPTDRADLLGHSWELVSVRTTAPGTRLDTTMRIFELYFKRARFSFQPDSDLVYDARRAHWAHGAFNQIFTPDSTEKAEPFRPEDFADYRLGTKNGATYLWTLDPNKPRDPKNDANDSGRVVMRGADTLLFRSEAHKAELRLVRVKP